MESSSRKGKSLLTFVVLFLIYIVPFQGKAQSTEVQQLLLNVEKLSQFKTILSEMKEGYVVVSNGYNAVKNISQGNFSLHEVFIDGLMIVNPEIKKYGRVADILTCQKNILSEYKSAFKSFKKSENFNETEISYLERVYKQLFDQSLDNLDQLANVITSSKLRMSDDERLKAIDAIYADTEDKLNFLRSFNSEVLILSSSREKERADLKQRLNLY